MKYERINWENFETGNTPIDANNLNKGDTTLYDIAGNKEGIIPINLTTASPVQSTTEPIVNAPIKFKITSSTTVVNNNLVSSRGHSVKSANKNLFDVFNLVTDRSINDTTGDVVVFQGRVVSELIDVAGGLTYSAKHFSTALGIRIFWYDGDGVFIAGEGSSGDSERVVTLPANARFVRILIHNYSSLTSYLKILLTFVEGGTQPESFIEHESSEVLFSQLLGSVPSVSDSIENDNGEWVQINRTNMGRDKAPYTLKGSDFTNFNDAGTNVNIAFMTNAFGGLAKKETLGIEGRGLISDGRTEAIADTNDWNNNNRTDIWSMDTSNTFYVTFPKTVTTLQQAQELIDGVQFNFELETPKIKRLPTQQLSTYPEFTQVSARNGIVKNELGTFRLVGGVYHLNDIRYVETYLNFKSKTIDDIIYNGVSVINLFTIQAALANGNVRAFISESELEGNNLDVDRIKINYSTIETNSNINVEVNASNSLAQAYDDQVQKVNVLSEDVKVNGDILKKSVGVLGAKSVDNFIVTTGGICTWENPTTSDFKGTEIYQAKFDINTFTYEQLNNTENVTKYDAGTGTSQDTTIGSETTYYYVAVSKYGEGGYEYRGFTTSVEITTPQDIIYYTNGTENIPWTVAGSGSTKESTYVKLIYNGIMQTNSSTIDVTNFSKIRITFDVLVSLSAVFLGFASSFVQNDFGVGVGHVLELDVSALNTGQIDIRNQNPPQNLGEIKITEVRSVA